MAGMFVCLFFFFFFQVLTGHTGSVLCLQYDDKVIISGSSDSTVRVWDVGSGEMVNTLIHHCEAVLHLRFNNGMMVTCSKVCISENRIRIVVELFADDYCNSLVSELSVQCVLQKTEDLNGCQLLCMFLSDILRWHSVFLASHCRQLTLSFGGKGKIYDTHSGSKTLKVHVPSGQNSIRVL